MHRPRVGVLRGGPSGEYDISLKTGASVLNHLSEERYIAKDIFISKDGVWHFRGMPTEPAKVLPHIDVIFNALHGEYGEDGTVQKVLDRFAVPYTGSSALPSALAMNKLLTKERLASHSAEAEEEIEDLGIKVPEHHTLEVSDSLEEEVLELYKKNAPPFVVKPLSSGSSVGITIAKSHNELLQGIYKAFEYSPKVMVEEYIRGKEATCGVVENFRGEDLYSMLPVEIVPPPENNFFDYDAKYSGKTAEICPGSFTDDEKAELGRLAKEVHKKLGLEHYSRSDFIVSPKGIYFLEANTLPGLTEESLVPKSLEAVGCSFPEFLDHLITLALNKK